MGIGRHKKSQNFIRTDYEQLKLNCKQLIEINKKQEQEINKSTEIELKHEKEKVDALEQYGRPGT